MLLVPHRTRRLSVMSNAVRPLIARALLLQLLLRPLCWLIQYIQISRCTWSARERKRGRRRERERERGRESANQTRQTRLKSTHTQCGLWPFIRSVDPTHTRTLKHTYTYTHTHTHAHVYIQLHAISADSVEGDWALAAAAN